MVFDSSISKVPNTQTDSAIIEEFKSVKIILWISFIFIEFEIKALEQGNYYLRIWK